MSDTPASQVDLAKLFSSVTHTLQENQQSLNDSDDYNHNHGDNMVENFQVITQAMRQTRGAPPAEQLAYASQALSQSSQTGSAQLYAQGLSRAADQFRGQSLITPENAMLLVQALMGGQAAGPQASQPAPEPQMGGMDLLSSLLGGQPEAAQGPATGADLMGGLFGGQAAPQTGQPSGVDLFSELLGGQAAPGQAAPGQAAPDPAQNQPAGGGLLGGLLNAFLGGAPAEQPAQAAPNDPSQPTAGGIDLNTLMAAGLAFFQARQQGAAPLAALVQAVMAGSQMTNTQHHTQSGQLVAGTLINTLATMLGGAH